MVANLSLSGSGRKVWWGGRLFEAGRLLTFSAFRMGAYSRWALIRGWALIRIKTVDRFPSLISKWLLQTLEKHENYRKAKWEHECAKVKMINCVRCVLSVITSILTDNVTWTCRGLFQPKTTSTSLLQLKVFSRITSDLLWI